MFVVHFRFKSKRMNSSNNSNSKIKRLKPIQCSTIYSVRWAPFGQTIQPTMIPTKRQNDDDARCAQRIQLVNLLLIILILISVFNAVRLFNLLLNFHFILRYWFFTKTKTDSTRVKKMKPKNHLLLVFRLINVKMNIHPKKMNQSNRWFNVFSPKIRLSYKQYPSKWRK